MSVERIFKGLPGLEDFWAGIAFKVVRTGGRHVGLVYKSVDGSIYFAHMAWHQCFINEAVPPEFNYLVVAPVLDDVIVQQFFADYCEYVARELQTQRPPYNFHEHVVFDADGKWICRDPDEGINCSSFVLGVFSSLKWPLADSKDWPIGQKSDIEDQLKLVEMMKNSHTLEDRIQAEQMMKHVGKHPRIAPEQTAGACLELEKSRPVKYETGKRNGLTILDHWNFHSNN